jgi:glycosyltransferase involved in cell wall biosynthesis
MKGHIASIVHGRFFAFDLVRELLKQGSDVTLFTNYPAWATARFGVPAHATQSYTLHGVLTRALQKLGMADAAGYEAFIHKLFGRWAARRVARGNFDVIQCFSGVAEEVFRQCADTGQLKILVRASAHIAAQRALLLEEEQRSGMPVAKPSAWMVERELREYALADRIVVLSRFCLDSFARHGVPESKLWLLPLGVEVSRFRSSIDEATARARRISSGRKLRVLTTGGFLVRKGAVDYVRIVEQLWDKFEFRWVGSVPREGLPFRTRLAGKASFVAKVPQYELKTHYDWADLYLYPTIEDGFPVVLSQAQAAGLPIIATPNSSAPDIVRDGENGWILPIRSPATFVEQLRWCDAHREELAQVACSSYGNSQPHDWSEVAARFRSLITTSFSPG